MTPDLPERRDPADLLRLSGRNGQGVGIADDRSMGRSAAMHIRQAGAERATTNVDERVWGHSSGITRDGQRVHAGVPIESPVIATGIHAKTEVSR